MVQSFLVEITAFEHGGVCSNQISKLSVEFYKHYGTLLGSLLAHSAGRVKAWVGLGCSVALIYYLKKKLKEDIDWGDETTFLFLSFFLKEEVTTRKLVSCKIYINCKAS